MKDSEKEIRHLLYIKSELIKQTKQEMRELNRELEEIRGRKKLEKTKNKGRR